MPDGRRTQPMPRLSLRLLYAEDSPADAEMALLCLKNEGIDATVTVVQTEEEFAARLASQEYDCILADYRLGAWTGLRALEILQEQRKTTPFILVTGTLGDELAVEIIKMGAADYVLKDRLTRLPIAIRRALEEKKVHDERARAEEELRKLNAELEQRIDSRTAELSQANTTLQSILDAATQLSVIACNLAGVITVFNAGAEQMLGYSAAEMEARGAELSEQYGRPIQGFDAFVGPARQGGFDEREWTYVRKDGSHLTVNVTVTARRDTDGSIIGFLGIAKDVTEHRRAEEERDRFFTLSLDMLCIARYDGYFKRLNPAWQKTLGFTTEELQAKPYFEFIHPEDRESTIAEAGKIMTGVDTVSFENRYVAKDGSFRCFCGPPPRSRRSNLSTRRPATLPSASARKRFCSTPRKKPSAPASSRTSSFPP